MSSAPHRERRGVDRAWSRSWGLGAALGLARLAHQAGVRVLICTVLFAAVQLDFTTASAARVRVAKDVAVPAFGARSLLVVNRRGQIHLIGWNRPDVQITAIKSGPTLQAAESLEVQVSRPGGRRIQVSTRVRRPAASQSMTRRRLLPLLERQRELVRQMVAHPATRKQSIERLDGIHRELSTLQRDLARDQAGSQRPADLSGARVDLKVYAPDHLSSNARTLDDDLTVEGMVAGAIVASHGGAIVVRRLAGNLRTWSESGSQRLSHVRGRVDAEGGHAQISIADIRGSVRVRLTSGDVEAIDVAGEQVDLRTIRGTVRLRGPLGRRGRYALVTLDGDLSLELSPAASAQLRGRAAHWDFGSFRPRGRRRGDPWLRAALGRGGPQLWLSAPGGSVRFSSSAR